MTGYRAATARTAPPAEVRTLAPLGRRLCPVLENTAVGAYRLIRALDAEGPPDPRPGQFYMLAAEAGWGAGEGERPYLPRAFSFARVRPRPAGGAELDFLLEAVGPGTGRLGALRAGDGLWLAGPLGVGFDPPADTPPILVGGGIGAAPLLALDDALESSPRLLLGFRSAAHAAAAGLFETLATLATDDGSAGRRGLVTDLLAEELEREPVSCVHACGPPAMLEAVRVLCAEQEVPAQLALEAGMACGFGACYGCAVPTRRGYLRLCVDGPVLDAAILETALVPGAGHG